MQHQFLKIPLGLHRDQKGSLGLEMMTVLTVSVITGIFCWSVFLTAVQLPNVREFANWAPLQHISSLATSDNATGDNVTHEISKEIDCIAYTADLSAVGSSLCNGILHPRDKSNSP